MAEHLYTYLLSTGTADILLTDMSVDFCHLLQIQLTRQHHHIGKLRIEAQGFHIADVELCAEVYLLPYLPGIAHHCHISGNDCRDACRLCRIYNGTHQRNVMVVYNGIDGEVALHAMFVARPGYFPQIVDSEGICRTGTHVQVLDTEIDGVGTCLYGCCERFARAYRCHDFEVTD